jgi:thiol:disulfide interchange protein/DsbC/DsbD-like thiol-disulfide interchange protein
MIRALFALLVCLVALPAAAQIDSAPKVQAKLISEGGAVAPGGTLRLALDETIRPTWHTYWVNPGEAGYPTAIKWTLPAGWKAGPIQWPYPKRLPVGPLMNYGYEGDVWLLTGVTAPADAKPGVYTLKADASWLVCQEVCIPEEQVLRLPISVSATPVAPYATVKEQFDAARARIPAPSPWPVVFAPGHNLDLFIASPQLAKSQLKDAVFFPRNEGVVAGMAPQRLGFAGDGLVLRLTRAKAAKIAKMLDGVVVLTSTDGSVQALTVNARPGAVPPARFPGRSGNFGLLLSLAFAFLGGLILNLMPCVLPILAIKALALANVAHKDRREAAREGFAYGIGAILSFVALGGLLVALRAGGQAIGWGFQLQEPAAVAGFALVIFAVGLNLSGVFEFSGGITAGDALTRRGGAVGSFFTGVLAVAVAAPCTAPFMAAALGYALTQSAAAALLVFLTLGLGFALPFVLIGLSPALQRVLPKPGAWMLVFKQLLAFPMYAAAAWLVWVLAQEAGSQALVAVLGAMILLAFAAWAWTASRNAVSRWRVIGGVFAALGLIGALASLPAIHATAAPPAMTIASQTAGIASQPYSATKLAQLRGENRPVFVDATAAWCITCLVNEKVALSNARVRRAFAARRVAYLVADWTSRNPEITALLAANGRSGVPLYLYYAPGAANPVVLPQILTEDDVLKAVGAS